MSVPTYTIKNYDRRNYQFQSPRPAFQYKEEHKKDINPEMESKLSDKDIEELDDFVNKLSPLSGPLSGTDPYPAVDKQRSQFINVGGLTEYAGNHKNYIRKGMSPFKQKKHSGGPIGTGGSGQAFRTTGNYRRIGTQYGSSRPHKIMTDIEDNPIVSLSDILSPIERSFLRQQKRINRVKSLLKEYLKL